jgi:hypothetical protein
VRGGGSPLCVARHLTPPATHPLALPTGARIIGPGPVPCSRPYGRTFRSVRPRLATAHERLRPGPALNIRALRLDSAQNITARKTPKTAKQTIRSIAMQKPARPPRTPRRCRSRWCGSSRAWRGCSPGWRSPPGCTGGSSDARQRLDGAAVSPYDRLAIPARQEGDRRSCSTLISSFKTRTSSATRST